MPRIALVLAGGDPPPAELSTILPPPVYTVAADSGISHARALDLRVDVLVGDLDSADEADVRWATEQGAVVEAHPAAKDQTDLELALERAAQACSDIGLDELVVVGLGGGRLDHWLANLLTLAAPQTESVDVTAYIGTARISVVRARRELSGRVGELISLVPVGGPVHGVTTTGLEYPLQGERLDAGSSRGVSNTFDVGADRATAVIELGSGTLLAIQPEHLSEATSG